MGRCVAASHRITDEPLPMAMVFPSELKATLYMELENPVSGSPMGCWVATSHKMTVASVLPDTRVLPSGLKAIPSTQLACPARGAPMGW